MVDPPGFAAWAHDREELPGRVRHSRRVLNSLQLETAARGEQTDFRNSSDARATIDRSEAPTS
jgi:hypothetical protein